ncbi:Inner membrane protein YidH [Nocardiopsis dassonvillei]|uniref:YidH family protein n=1 Tax=Nocardiopsis dassonvillei TaxID=2014 RepID=UPI003F57044B
MSADAADGDTGAGGDPVDYRFTLANERTFLAWVRTALALLAGAVAVLHLLPLGWDQAPRTVVGLTLAALAAIITVYAPMRWYRVQRIMRNGGTLRLSVLPLLTTFAVGMVCLVVLLGHLL